MQRLVFSLALIFFSLHGYSQSRDVHQINEIVTPKNAFEPLYYLASDELKGRGTKRPEIHVAAKYISDYFKKHGINQVSGTKDYYQTFELKSIVPANKGALRVNDSTFEIGKDLLQIGGQDVSLSTPVVYVGFANPDDLAKVNVAGKIVLTDLGSSDSSSFQQALSTMRSKQQLLKEKGAIAIIERFWHKSVPWSGVQSFFGRDRYVQHHDTIPVFLLRADASFAAGLSNMQLASLSTEGNKLSVLPAKNVMGSVRGTDPALKDQYIVLTAHYDHLGVAVQPKEEAGKIDSIYNGTRDNAIGVTAVMNAARYFAKHPAKRSMLFILFTGEEMGLLGSRYFSDNPTVPLNKIVYNLNCDNGGYNDTTIVTVVGLGRTSADDDIKKAAAAYGVKAIPDPVPDLHLFDRSDNVNFAVNGIPAPTYGMGVTAFDSVVMKYYHQLSDEVNTFNLSYGLTYIRSYISAAKNIANNPLQPKWVKGDKYEEAWKKRYSR
jgi:hypothetical protein